MARTLQFFPQLRKQGVIWELSHLGILGTNWDKGGTRKDLLSLWLKQQGCPLVMKGSAETV